MSCLLFGVSLLSSYLFFARDEQRFKLGGVIRVYLHVFMSLNSAYLVQVVMSNYYFQPIFMLLLDLCRFGSMKWIQG